MDYVVVAIVGLVLVLLLGTLLMRGRRKTSAPACATRSPSAHPSPLAQIEKLKRNGRFWGFSVESHCRASSAIAGSRFAFDAAPPLPVPGCTSAQCTCCLIGLPDRRSRVDRRSGQDRRRSIRVESSDRRVERPRRQADLDSWVTYSHL